MQLTDRDPWLDLIRDLNGEYVPRPPPKPRPLRIETDFGKPLDFGPPTPLKPSNYADPMIWGAWGGIGGAAVGTIASLSHQLSPSQTVFGFGMGGLFWIGACAHTWNWLGRRLNSVR